MRAILINELDNCATLVENAKANDLITIYNQENEIITELKAKENIPYGNKIAIKDIKKDEFVYKYGEKIAIATKDITKHSLVHVHNTKSLSVDIPKVMKDEIIRQMEIKI